jgi:hypothetical protein
MLKRRHSIRSFALCLGITAAAGVLSAPVASATTAPAADGSGGSAAVITPSIRMMKWFGTTGLGEGCNLTLSLVGAGADYFQVVPATAPFLGQGVTQCANFGTQNGAAADQGIAASQSLTAVNPIFNPGIDALSNGANSIGTDQHDAVSPFGPTIQGFAKDIAFFGGS